MALVLYELRRVYHHLHSIFRLRALRYCLWLIHPLFLKCVNRHKKTKCTYASNDVWIFWFRYCKHPKVAESNIHAAASYSWANMHLHFIINWISLSLIPLSNLQIMIKEQQEVFQAYGFSMGGKGKGGYQSRITFNVKLNHASLRTF